MSQAVPTDQSHANTHGTSNSISMRPSNGDADSQSRSLRTSSPPLPPPYAFNDRSQNQLQPIQPSQNSYQNGPYYSPSYQSSYPPPPVQYSLGTGSNNQQQSPTVSTTTPTPTTGETPKRSRLARACDQCSERKVKCDTFGPPCKPCKDLDLPCTNNRETKRRGPRNRLAEQYHQAKRQKLEESSGEYPSTISSGDRHESAEALAYLSSQGGRLEYNQRLGYGNGTYEDDRRYGLGASGIIPGRVNIDKLLCPKPLLDLLVDDFFTYIHIVAPFPHEPSFRSAYRDQLYLTDSKFLALLASMIGTLVASFPRKPKQHLKAHNLQGEFATSLDFVKRCHSTATEARGAGYLDRNLSIYDAATSYFLGLAAAYSFEWRRCRLYFSETWGIIRTLGVHRSFDGPSHGMQRFSITGQAIGDPDTTSVDYIQQQIGRRLFWVMLVAVRSLQQLGSTFGELFIPPPTATDPYPPFPEEVDDDFIFPDHIEQQPSGMISRMVGFNINVKIYSAVTKIARMETAYGVDQIYDWQHQKRILNECYENVEKAFDHIPIELLLKPGDNAGEFASPDPSRQFVDYSNGQQGGETPTHIPTPESMTRREIQFEIQKANIYISQLGTKSYIVEKFWNLQDAVDKMSSIATSSFDTRRYSEGHTNLYPHAPRGRRKRLEDRVAQERENIVKELLRVVCSISKVNMEPNGGSFVSKIRQIASTLIETNDTRKGPVAHQSQEFLGRLLDVLVNLERSGPAPTMINAGANNPAAPSEPLALTEEEELIIWADLREVQLAFLANGGFMGIA